ncbi:MAG: glycosyltransferase [Planctomycetes bacterium]|nr:glycosyltransferase [Planctomycetota bacterium]
MPLVANRRPTTRRPATRTRELRSSDTVGRHSVADYLKWKNRNRYYYAGLKQLFQLNIPAGARVLEIGSGDGDLLAAVQPKVGVGIDTNGSIIEYASKRHPGLTFHQADGHDFEIDQQFDYVILSNLLGEVDDIQQVLQQIQRMCHAKTKLLITHYNDAWEPVLRLAQHLGLRRPMPLQNWLSFADMHNLLEMCDYRVVRKQLRTLLPKYVPLLSHFCNRFLGVLPGINHLCMTTFVVAMPKPAPLDPKDVTCTVVIPTKNEKGNIENAIKRTPAMGKHTEFIFVDGQSTDGTIEEIQRVIEKYPDHDIKYFQQDGKGKGDAVRKAFAHAEGDVLIILDSDLTVPPEDMPKFFDALVCGRGEFINGSRLVYPLEEQSMRFLNHIANKTFAAIFSWLLEQRLKDTLCGTKVLHRDDYALIAANRDYFGEFDPFGDFDLLFGAAKLNLKIVEIPIRYQPRSYGEIKINRFRDGWMLLKMCCLAFRKLKL